MAQLNIEADSNPMSDEVLPYLTRSVIKQPVMTSNYNVTRIGAKDHMKQKLKDAEFPNERLKPCSMYLANVTLDSLGDVFTGPQKLMRWIEESTKSIKVYPSVGLKWKLHGCGGCPAIPSDQAGRGEDRDAACDPGA